MHEVEVLKQTLRLVEFFETKQFDPVTQRTPYYHMGATITDSVLQAGLNYRYVVYPRVLRLLTEFSDYRTTCDFIILIQTIPISELLQWNNSKKLNLIKDISWLLFERSIETEIQLACWLSERENEQQLLNMNGVGPKTIDYLRMLSGSQAIAIDRHLLGFLRLAGITINSYQEARAVYCNAAKLLRISEYELDRKVWLYMTKVKTNKQITVW